MQHLIINKNEAVMIQSQATQPIIDIDDLRKIAEKLKLSPSETNLYIDLITDLFPNSTKSYCTLWATRIKNGFEYFHAAGDTRLWLDQNHLYDRVKEQRAAKPKLKVHMRIRRGTQ